MAVMICDTMSITITSMNTTSSRSSMMDLEAAEWQEPVCKASYTQILAKTDWLAVQSPSPRLL
jgi:hypothetical protein